MAIGTKITVGLAFALAVITAVGMSAYVSTAHLLEANRWVTHTHLVMEKLEHVLSTLKDAETGQRGYVLTGEERYLEPYDAAHGLLHGEIESLKELVKDNPAQLEALQQVQTLSNEKLTELQETIELRKQSGLDAALQVVRTDKGKKIMDDLRGVVVAMEDREQRLLDARNASAEASANRTILTVAIGTPASLLALVIFALGVTRKTGLRRRNAPPGSRVGLWGQIALRYSFVVMTVAVATALRLWLARSFGPLPPFITLYPAVLLVASVAGGGPGILASILAAFAADYFFIPPVGQFSVGTPNDMLALAIFTATNLLLSVLMERLRRAQQAEAVSATQEEELDLLDMGIILALDPDYRIVRWSEGCRRLYGYGAEEAVGRFSHELFQAHPDESLEEARRLLIERGYWQGERVRRAKDGTELAIEVLWALRRDEQGEPEAILEVSADITSRKRAEEALRVSEARYATTLSSIGDAVIATDLTGAISFMNPEAQNLTGWSFQEALRRPVKDVFRIINEDTRTEAESPVAKVLREGLVVGLANHTLLVRKDGTEVPIDDSGAPIICAEGKITGVVLVFRDITERKRAEEALQEQREWLRVTLASIGDAVLAVDTASKITFLNPACSALTGWHENEALGRPVQEVFRIINEKTREPGDDIIGRVLRDDCLVSLANHTALVARDGREIPIEDSAAPIRDARGTVLGAVLVFHDVTEKRRALEQLRNVALFPDENPFPILRADGAGTLLFANRSASALLDLWQCRGGGALPESMRQAITTTLSTATQQELEVVCGGRDLSLVLVPILERGYVNFYGRDMTERKRAEEALRASEEDLKRLVDNLARSNRDLQQFAYVASHDLQEPLRQVTAFVQLIESRYKDRLDEAGTEYMGFVVEGALRMQSLILDLLAYSRVDSAGRKLEPVPVRDVIEQALHNLSVSIDENEAAVTWDEMPTVNADRAQLIQVFQNMIGNAVKFRGETAPAIHVGVERQGNEWVFSVRDNGVGFDPSLRDKIFQLFQRLHSREVYPGTGIGLTICKRVIERHDGRIWAESEPGEGATFYFALPAGD